MSWREEFVCLRCGKCCSWHGLVHLSNEEVDRIAEFLGMETEAFLSEFTVLTPDRRGLSLTERADGGCIFYDEKETGCRIQEVKPLQCRRFPVEWSFPGFENECAGGAAAKMKRKES